MTDCVFLSALDSRKLRITFAKEIDIISDYDRKGPTMLSPEEMLQLVTVLYLLAKIEYHCGVHWMMESHMKSNARL